MKRREIENEIVRYVLERFIANEKHGGIVSFPELMRHLEGQDPDEVWEIAHAAMRCRRLASAGVVGTFKPSEDHIRQVILDLRAIIKAGSWN